MSTVTSESAFSAGERTVTDKRNRLNPQSIKFCICYKDWLDQAWRKKEFVRDGNKFKAKLIFDDIDEVEDDNDIVETPNEESPLGHLRRPLFGICSKL